MSKPLLLVSANAAWNLVNFRLGLLEALIADGYAIATVAPSEDSSDRALRAIGCAVYHIDIDPKGLSPVRDIRTAWRYWQLMRRLQPVAYLGWTIKPNIYGAIAARFAGVPSLLNVSGLGTVFLGDRKLRAVAMVLYRSAFSQANTVFFQNRDDCELFVKRKIVRASQTVLVPGSGIDIKRFQPSSTQTPPGNHFLMIARLLGDKGVREYVAAARALRQMEPMCRFSLLGFVGVENRTAIDRRELDAWIAEGIVDYHEPVSDVGPAIQGADCVVLPSYREGTSRVLLEAAAMGKPLIATDVPGCREIVENGVNGYLCAARDSHSLAEALRRFARASPADKRRMGQASREKTVAEFTEQIVIDAYISAVSKARTNAADG